LDERAIPVIVLVLNLLFYIFVIVTTEFTIVIGVWGIVLGVCQILVAYTAYENAKRVDFLEEHVWKRINEIDEWIKLNRNFMEDLKKRMDKN